MVSVPAPPPMVASPPPCPACNSTAVARITESRIRMPTRIPYMRGARCLGGGGAHKLRPAAGIERRSPHQHAVQLVFRQQFGSILRVHGAAIEDHKRRGRHGVVFQPASYGPMHFGGVFGRRVAASPDRPHGLVRDRHASLAVPSTQRRLELACDHGQRLACLALLQLLPNAQDRLQIACERGGHLLAGLLVRFTEHVTTFRVADQREPGAGLLGQRRRCRAGEGALRFPVNVLRAGLDVAMTGYSLCDRLDRNGRREKPHRPLVRDLTGRKECPQVLASFDGPDVHLPVAREDQRSHTSSNAATPGNSFPSRNSSDAPPPVETCVSLSSIPATAATESPPPMTVTAPFFPASTSAVAIARVPASNGGVSNTPIGPFQKIVFARSSRARKSCCVASSISYTAHLFGIASAVTDRFSLARSSDGAITAPRGRISFLPLDASSSLASAMRSGSTSDEPTSSPMAAKQVQAIAPPNSSSSTRGSSERITSILPEILAPPSTATKGCLGSLSSLPRYCSSFSIKKPATAGLRRCATASVDACARCAEPNASFTYRSPRAANVLANSGSFFSSPGQKRVFSTRATPPRGSRRVAATPVAGSAMNSTGAPSSVSRSRTICLSEYCGSGPPLGLPRCESSTTRAPFSRRYWIVGNDARRRVSSLTLPFFSGTLKSTRTSARLPSSACGGRSRRLRFFNGGVRCRRGDPRRSRSSPSRCHTTTRRAPACRR